MGLLESRAGIGGKDLKPVTFGFAVDKLAEAVDSSEVKTALRPILMGEVRMHSTDAIGVIQKLRSQTSSPTPEDFNVAMEMSKLNDASVWEGIIAAGVSQDSEVGSYLAHAFQPSHERTVALRLSYGNKNFFQDGSVLLGLAAKHGPHFLNKFRSLIDNNARILPAAQMVAARFPAPSSGPIETISRLDVLFSPTEPNGASLAMNALRRGQGFLLNGPGSAACPAIHLTADIYSAYSEFLKDPAYQEVLLTNLSRV